MSIRRGGFQTRPVLFKMRIAAFAYVSSVQPSLAKRQNLTDVITNPVRLRRNP